MTDPLVSVIIPVWNHTSTLEACLASVFAQTYPKLEVIVVDDGSESPVQTAHARVLLIREPHRGASAARNAGARHARGEFFIFVDADVIMDPSMVQKMIDASRANPSASFIYCGFRWGSRTMGLERFDPNRIRDHNFISMMSLIRAAHFPGFDPELLRLQDWDVWLTMVQQHHYGCGIPEILFLVNTRGHISRGGLSYLRAVKRLKQKHGIPMTRKDYWIALKEFLRPW